MSAPDSPADPKPNLLPRYRAKLRLARLALTWERLWPAAWPALGIAGAFVALALFDVLPFLAGWLHALALAAFAGAFGFAAYRGWQRFAAPDDAAAQRRLEIASGFKHRPLVALNDTLAAGRNSAASHTKLLIRLCGRRKQGVAVDLLRVRDGVCKRESVM